MKAVVVVLLMVIHCTKADKDAEIKQLEEAAARHCMHNGSSQWCKRAKAGRELRRQQELQRRTVSKDKDCSVGSGWDEYEARVCQHSPVITVPRSAPL